jgi:hypothetical protein
MSKVNWLKTIVYNFLILVGGYVISFSVSSFILVLLDFFHLDPENNIYKIFGLKFNNVGLFYGNLIIFPIIIFAIINIIYFLKVRRLIFRKFI